MVVILDCSRTPKDVLFCHGFTFSRIFQSIHVFPWLCVPTCHSPSDLPGCLLSHLQGCLLTVPGSMWCADQIRGILQRTLTETGTCTAQSVRAEVNDFIRHRVIYSNF